MTVEIRTEPVAEPRTKTVADVLRHAALVIEEVGWSDFEPLCEDGRRCAGGAISFVAVGGNWEADDPLVDAAATALMQYLGKESHGHPMGGVARWNDGHESGEAVVTALRAAADAWEAGR